MWSKVELCTLRVAPRVNISHEHSAIARFAAMSEECEYTGDMSDSSELKSIERRIGELVREYVEPNAAHAQISPSLQPMLKSVVRQALSSSESGKRLRALLTIDAYDAMTLHAVPEHTQTASAQSNVLDFACAIEVFQTAALVHDDLIDDSDLRRGKPSAHCALTQQVGQASIGRGLGLMLGDMLATACTMIMEHASAGMNEHQRLVESFLAMQRDVEIGQVLDLAIERMPLDDPRALAQASLNVFRWKTASYTTIAPLQLAFLAADVPAQQAQEHAFAIGLPLGQAFQLADDLIDVIGSSRATGKPVGGDIKEGKRTVLLADALELGDDTQRARLQSLYEQDERSSQEISEVIALFHSTGAVYRSRQRIGDLWDATQSAISQLQLLQDQSQLLRSACARFLPDFA